MLLKFQIIFSGRHVLSFHHLHTPHNSQNTTTDTVVFVTKWVWLLRNKMPPWTGKFVGPHWHTLIKTVDPSRRKFLQHVGILLLYHLPNIKERIFIIWCLSIGVAYCRSYFQNWRNNIPKSWNCIGAPLKRDIGLDDQYSLFLWPFNVDIKSHDPK